MSESERDERVTKWDQSGLKEACQRGLAIGRTHQKFDLQLLLDMLLEIERLESLLDSQAAGDATWSKESPKVDGVYWWRADRADFEPDIHSVVNGRFYKIGESFSREAEGFGGEWLGPITPESATNDAATRMRDRCVQKVREMAQKPWVDYGHDIALFALAVERELHSLQFETRAGKTNEI